jgi:hypothetical protein
MRKYNVELHIETNGTVDVRNDIWDALTEAARKAPSDVIKIDVDRVTNVSRWPPVTIWHFMAVYFMIVDAFAKSWGAFAFACCWLALQLFFDWRSYKRNDNWKV